MKECIIEPLFYLLCQRTIAVGIFRKVLQQGKLLHQFKNLEIVCGGDQFAIGNTTRVLRMNQLRRFGRHAPVAILIARHEVIICHILILHMADPLFHAFVVFLNRLQIAELPIEHIGIEKESGRPGDDIRIVVPESGSHIGNGAIFTLCFTDIIGPFAVKLLMLEEITLAQSPHCPVAQPGLTFVSLGTVYRHSLVVTPYSPECIFHDLVDYRVGCLYGTDEFHLIIDHFADKIIFGYLSRIASYLHIPETMVDKYRSPLFQALSLENIFVGHPRIPQVIQIEVAVGLHCLGKTKLYGISLVSFHLHPDPANHVLPHIQYILVFFKPRDREGLQGVDHLHSFHHLRPKRPVRDGHSFSGPPGGVIVSHFTPSGQLFSCIVLFPVVLVIAPDGAVGSYFPGGIAADHLCASVFILYIKSEAQLWVAEGGNLIGLIILSHGVVAAVSEGHPHGIAIFLE